MNENPITGFFTWQVLGTQAGATAATLIIIRILDQATPDKWKKVPLIVIAYLVGAFILVGADVALPPLPDVASISLCFVNAFGVAVAAIGGDVLIRRDSGATTPPWRPMAPPRSQIMQAPQSEQPQPPRTMWDESEQQGD